MKRFEFYKNIYDRENQRRTSLSTSINIPFGIITAIFTASAFLFSSHSSESMIANIAFYTLLFLSLIFCCISGFFLSKSFNRFYKGHKYKELPLMSVIEKYYLDLKEYYKDDTKTIDRELEEFLISELVTYTDLNTELNDSRSLDLYKAKKHIFFATLSLALTCVPFVEEYSKHYIESQNETKNCVSPISEPKDSTITNYNIN